MEECSWFKFNHVGTGTRYGLEILHKCCKRVESENQKVLGIILRLQNSTLAEVTREKLAEGAYLSHPK